MQHLNAGVKAHGLPQTTLPNYFPPTHLGCTSTDFCSPGASIRPALGSPAPDTPSLAGTPLPQPLLLQSLHRRLWLNLLVLGFNLLLLVAICVIGSQSEDRRGQRGWGPDGKGDVRSAGVGGDESYSGEEREAVWAELGHVWGQRGGSEGTVL